MKFLLPLLAGAVLISSQFAHATSVGLSTDPMGALWNRMDPNTGYAVWDQYSGFSFIGDTPDSTNGFSSVGLDQSVALTGNITQDAGAGIYANIDHPLDGGDDVLYSGGLLPSFSLDGTTTFTVLGAFLQIKRAGNTASFIGTINPTLNGIPYDSVSFTSGSGDTTSDAGTWSVTTYSWGASLVSQNITSFDIAFTSPNHRGIDSVVIDVGPVSPIPEPTAWALGLAGVGMIVLFRRRSVRC